MTDDRGRDRGGLLHRVSGWAMQHAGLAVFLWVLVLVGVTVGSTLVGNAANAAASSMIPAT